METPPTTCNDSDIPSSDGKQSNNCVHILAIIRHPVGGIRTFIRYVYTNFNKANYHFTLLAPDLPELHVLLNDLKCFETDFIPINQNPSGFHFFLSVSKAIFGGKFDLVHSHGFTSGLCSILPSILTKTPHIMTSHDILQQNQFQGMKGLLKKKVLSLLFPMIDVIHAVSNDARANLIEFLPRLRCHNNKVVAIQNGIEVERFNNSQTRDFRHELELGNNTFLIGFLGRFMSPKGFRYLIEALELMLLNDLPKKPLILTFGEGCFVREEIAGVTKRGLDRYVNFLPFVPNPASTIKGLDVVVMPSLWEACPLQPMEAMVSGVPVIGTNCIGLREVLEDTSAKIITPKDSKALANAIIEEMSNPSTYKSRQFAGEAAIRFDVKKQASRLEHIILNLIKQKSS